MGVLSLYEGADAPCTWYWYELTKSLVGTSQCNPHMSTYHLAEAVRILVSRPPPEYPFIDSSR